MVRISTTKGGSESVQKRVVSTSTTEGGSESVQKSGQDHHKKKARLKYISVGTHRMRHKRVIRDQNRCRREHNSGQNQKKQKARLNSIRVAIHAKQWYRNSTSTREKKTKIST